MVFEGDKEKEKLYFLTNFDWVFSPLLAFYSTSPLRGLSSQALPIWWGPFCWRWCFKWRLGPFHGCSCSSKCTNTELSLLFLAGLLSNIPACLEMGWGYTKLVREEDTGYSYAPSLTHSVILASVSRCHSHCLKTLSSLWITPFPYLGL